MRWFTTGAVAVAATLLACTPDPDPPRPAPTADATAAPRPTATEPAEPTERAAAAETCPSGQNARPGKDAQAAPFDADVDGDGEADEVFADGTKLGVRTAAGGTSSFQVPTAKPYTVLGAADADGDGADEVFVELSTVHRQQLGTGVIVAVFTDCALKPLRNVDGDPYTFLLGEWEGELRGVGCAGDGDRRSLVGLAGKERPDGSVRWSRTVVEIDQDQARNAAVRRGSYERGRDDRAIGLLGEASCGRQRFREGS